MCLPSKLYLISVINILIPSCAGAKAFLHNICLLDRDYRIRPGVISEIIHGILFQVPVGLADQMKRNLGPRGNEPQVKPRVVSSSQEDRGGSLSCGIDMGSEEKFQRVPNQTRRESWTCCHHYIIPSPKLT